MRQNIQLLKRMRYLLICSLFFLPSCKKLIEIDAPRTQIVTSAAFADDASATSAIRGIYSTMAENSFANGNRTSLTLYAGLSSDEFINYNPVNIAIAQNALTIQNSVSSSDLIWSSAYKIIYYANSILKGLEESGSVTATVKSQLKGEALFIRAFCYFYLTNLFGDIPLATTIDYKINNALSRSSTSEVYKLIIADLKESKTLLAADYSFSSGEKVRPNKWAATALLARAYLFQQEWTNAESEASDVIDNSGCEILTDPNKVFLANSDEAILQLMPVEPGDNTEDGNTFIMLRDLDGNLANYQYLSDYLIDRFSYNDKRLAFWTDTIKDANGSPFYYPYKYKVVEDDLPLTEYSMILRLSEMFLVRAEARAELDNINGSEDDINVIRNRAGLADTTFIGKSEAVDAIILERSLELMSEWGHRWLDLKRRNLADEVLQPVKGADWQSTDVLYPIPQLERDKNPRLSQNAGYQQ